MTSKGLIAGVLLVLFLIVLGQNTEVVTIRFLFWKFSMSRIVLMLLSMLAGVVIGFVVARVTSTTRSQGSKVHRP